MQAGVCTFRHAPNPPHTKATVTRTTPASDTDAAQCLADDAVRGCDKVTFWNNETTAHDKTGTMKVGYIFYRCGRDDTLAKAAQHILTDGPKHLKGVVLMLHTVEQSFTSDILLKLLDPSPIGAEPPPHAPLLMVNLSAQCEEEVTGRKLLGTVRWISIALEFCAFEIVKWTPAKSGANLGSLLSFIKEASNQPANLYAVPQMHKTRLGTTRVPRPFFTAPVIMKVNSASVTEAHMIMKLVYDYSGHFPGLTVEMALRMWVRAKNWAAVGVVCRAHSFTQFEAIDLSHLSLESVPEELRGLSFKTLNLSDNKITKIPKWLAEMPNVIWGEGPRSMILHEVEKRRNCVKIDTHKLVFVGDGGAGKTTLLKCMMKNLKKLRTKHVPTGLSVYYNVKFRDKTKSWTVWDLGGESQELFHPWFFLSKSTFIVVFHFLALSTEKFREPRLNYWLNELSVARSRGDKTKRTIIPVGTHVTEEILNSVNFHLERIFQHESIPVAFFLQLSDGQGWKCSGVPIQKQHSPKGVNMLLSHLETDLADCSVPQSWVVLNKKLTKSREKGGISTLSWTQFVELASSCGVATTEECAPFLAEIGTIIHFRYPFWLLSPNHPGTAATPGLPELVIVEPHSFLVRLLSDLRSRSQPNLVTSKPVFNSQTEPALKTIMYEFGVIIEHHLLSDYVPSAEKYLSFLNPPHSTDKLYKYFHSFWQAPTSPSITYRLNGVVIQFALFPEDLFLKLISRVANVYPGQWDLQFWSRSVVFFSNSDLGALLFLTCNDERLTICLRSTDRDDWSALQRNVWTSIISTIHSFFDFMHCQYEETSQLFDWAAIAKERSPCPHCLLKGLTSQDSWLNPSRSIFLPPTAEWKRNDILGVLKSGGREMLCGTLKIPILSIAPDLIPRFESCSGTEPVTTVTTQLSDILGQRVEQRTTLEDLLTTLIEKGNGTTSVLDQVIPNGLRLKILRDVAQGLGDLHRRDPPIIHGRISPAYILVLSLDDSGTGPRAKIMDSDRACTVFSHRTRIPESLSRDEMKFVAPEVLSHSFFDTKADVWSFGMTSLLTLNPLNQPFTHITSNRKYRCTDYNSPATGTATTSHNRNKYRLGLNQYTVGRDLLKGAITPFPPSTADSRTHNLEIHDRLRMQIASLCLGSNPDTRPSMDNIVKIWDYFQPP